jgi:hypothetical protein
MKRSRIHICQNSDGQFVLTCRPHGQLEVLLRLGIDSQDGYEYAELRPGCRVRYFVPDGLYHAGSYYDRNDFAPLSASVYHLEFCRMRAHWATINRLVPSPQADGANRELDLVRA